MSTLPRLGKLSKETSLSVPGDLTPDFHDHLSSLLSNFESFRVQINDASRLSTQDGLEESVLSAYDICHNYNEQDFEIVSDKASNAKKLSNALGFLGRLNTCFKTLIRAAERLPGFRVLQIIPVTVLPAGRRKSKASPKHRWSLTKTFSALGLNLNDQTVQSLFKAGRKEGPWTTGRLLRRFDKPEFQVHAEVQVLLAAARHGCTRASTFKYVGCSKRSCFFATVSLGNMGILIREGVMILEDIEKDMKDSFLDSRNDKHQHAQESIIGGSSMATVIHHFDNPYIKSLASRHLEAQCGNILPETRKTVNSESLR